MPSPIFIVGPPRSGTTLVAKILGLHSRIFMPGETHFFDDIYSRRRDLGNLESRGAAERALARLRTLYDRYNEPDDQKRIDGLLQERGVISRLLVSRDYKELFSSFMEIQAERAAKKRWGNNVPKDLFHTEELLSFFADAKIIACVRDPRDFILSYQNKWKATPLIHADRMKRLYHPVLTALLWRASVREICRLERHLPADRLIIVKYEQLVMNPEENVRRLCFFIGEEFEQNMLSVAAQNSSFEAGGSGIYTSSVGRWRSRLSREEVYITELVAKQLLTRFGYKPSGPRVRRWRIVGFLATLPYAAARAAHANRALRGPLLPYLMARFSALLP